MVHFLDNTAQSWSIGCSSVVISENHIPVIQSHDDKVGSISPRHQHPGVAAPQEGCVYLSGHSIAEYDMCALIPETLNLNVLFASPQRPLARQLSCLACRLSPLWDPHCLADISLYFLIDRVSSSVCFTANSLLSLTTQWESPHDHQAGIYIFISKSFQYAFICLNNYSKRK